MPIYDTPRRRARDLWMTAAIFAAAPAPAFAQSAPAAPASTASPSPSSSSSSGLQDPRTGAVNVKGVTVTGRQDRVRSSPDSRSYDLAHDLQAQTGSVADVLRNVPSVTVDPDGKVSLRGDPNVVIYVDGKPSSLFKGQQAGQALQSVPADQYERVEVMTNPSAAYSPDGSAGIINLITKKTKKPGRWGSLKVSEGSAGRDNVGVTASQRTDKLTLNFSAGARRDRGGSAGADTRETLDGSGAVVSTLANTSRASNRGDSGWASGSAEWNPDAKTQLTAELTGWTFRGRYDSDTRAATEDPVGDLSQRLQLDSAGDYAGAGFSGGLTWRRTFDSDLHSLVVSLTRQGATNTNLSRLDQASLTPVGPDSFQRQHRGDFRPQTELKADYVRPMPLEATLKAGLDIRDEADRADNSGFLNAASPDAPNAPGQTDLFRFDRRISAVYATYNQPIGRLTTLLGLRLEDTRTDLDDETTRFSSHIDNVSLYPTVHLGWKLTEHQQLSASYSGRVQRPWSNQMDPFRYVYGPYNASQGNPDLKPEQTRKLEFGYEYKAGGSYYSATTYYRYSDDGFANVVTDLGNSVFLNTPENLSRSRGGGLELIASGKLFKTLSYNLSGNDSWNQIDVATAGFTPQSGWTFAGHGSLDWQATPKDLFQIQGSLNGRQVTPQGYGQSGPMVNLGYRRKFDDRLALQLSAQDAFGQAYNSYAASEAATFNDTGWRKIHDRAAYASLIWSFGRGPKKESSFDEPAPAPGPPTS